MQVKVLGIQDARKLVKEGFRELYARFTGNPAWWETPDADKVRQMVAVRARQVVALQSLEGVVAAPAQTAEAQAQAPKLPEVKPEEHAPEAGPVSPERERELRVMAAQLYPTPAGMDQREKKKQYHRRRVWLVAMGLPKRGLLPGQVVFGRKVD